MKNTGDLQTRRVFVKVFGFTDAERHALNTAFVLFAASHTAYAMWSVDSDQPAQLTFIDGESWEASLEMANPEHDALKVIWVGRWPPAKAWRVFERPLRWAAIIKALDSFYERPQALPEPGDVRADIDFDLGADIPPCAPNRVGPDVAIDFGPPTEPQPLDAGGSDEAREGRNRILLIDTDRAARLYWRAKLASAGHLLVDDAPTGEVALQLVRAGIYTLVILDVDLTDVNSWVLLKVLKEATPSITQFIVTGASLTLRDTLRAWFSGARGSLRKPLDPGEVGPLLKRLQH